MANQVTISSQRITFKPGLAVLAVSLLLHLCFLNWASERIGTPAIDRDARLSILVALHPTPTVLMPVAPPTALPPAIATPLKSSPLEPDPMSEPTKHVPPISEEAVTSPTLQSEVSNDASSPAPKEAIPDLAPPPEDAIRSYQVVPPPSVELKYKTEAMHKGSAIYGASSIRWIKSDNRYLIQGETRALFFSLLNFTSEGLIDSYGVSPVRYSEKRFRKSETNTHFHRERNTISFSASTASYPRQGGEQDRASIIWQLVGIGLGNKENISPGAYLNFVVAGDKNADVWHIQVIDNEPIRVNEKYLNAWHLIRLPHPDSYDQKLEIWLAPQQGWLPVRLRTTEKNGDTVDMSLSEPPLFIPDSASHS